MITRLEELANKFKSSWKKPNREELNEFVKESLLVINQVNDLYKKFFAQKKDENGNLLPSLLSQIESKISKLWELYNEYMVDIQEETNNTIEQDIESFVESIKTYHKELLEWNNSIKADIEDSQEKINEFFSYLFDKITLNEWEESAADAFKSWEIRSDKLKQYITDIKTFHDQLEWNEEKQWYKEAIESFHNYLYQKQDWKTENRADKAKKDIQAIQDFRNNKFDTIVWEIDQAQKDAKSLLHAATWWSLIEWYEQSKNEYKLTKTGYERINDDTKSHAIISILIRNVGKVLWYYWSIIFDYILFVTPLAISVVIFVQPQLLEYIWIDTASVWNISFWSRLLISVPLWWISLFGQRNLSQRKRIAEEYNHKVQVLKTYLNFTTNEWSYPSDKIFKQELHKEVLEVIKRRPWDIYWKDESLFDKIIDLIKSARWIKEEEKRTETNA